MQCVIWTNPGGGLCNMDQCYKRQYLYKVRGKCFISYIYRNIVQYCTVRVSFPEVQSLVEAGRTDVQIARPF